MSHPADPPARIPSVEQLLQRGREFLDQMGPRQWKRWRDLVRELVPAMAAQADQLNQSRIDLLAMAAQLAFVCDVDTEDTQRNARANLVKQVTAQAEDIARLQEKNTGTERVGPDHGWASVADFDVCRSVDREMDWRERAENVAAALEAKLDEKDAEIARLTQALNAARAEATEP